MRRVSLIQIFDLLLWSVLIALLLLQFLSAFELACNAWLQDSEFAYGALVPALVGYLIWLRRQQLRQAVKASWPISLSIIAVGIGLQIIASLSQILVLSGIALSLTLIGTVGFLWGRQCLRITALPLGFISMMFPLPPYFVDQITWHLKVIATTLSATTLGLLGVPVYQDGNLITLPNYVLEVRDACSGSRSIFALLTLGVVLALTAEDKWRRRILLIASAPSLAIAMNIVRIVGTGLIAWRYGSIAANESLHTAWGILLFVIAVTLLIGFQRLLRWADEYWSFS